MFAYTERSLSARLGGMQRASVTQYETIGEVSLGRDRDACGAGNRHLRYRVISGRTDVTLGL
jgi:hypothetical protein